MENQQAPKQNSGGCFTGILMLFGMVCAGISTLGFIIGFFGYQLKVSGSKLPMITWDVYIPLMVVAAFVFGLGWGIDWIAARRAQNRAKKSNGGM